MRLVLILIVLICVQLQLESQSVLKGTVIDENNEPLIGATVVLLEPVDSSMMSFAISDSDGRYELEDISSGSYVLQISFVSYATLMKEIEVSSERKQDLGESALDPISEVLQEVTVKAEHIPMGVIGDTISYNAAAFKTKPGATVEDLLKKLPGVEVERDGSIKAMGEEVQNVLVDGKEFFGDDPKIATKNLEAEAVDKVQVFDKKSEIAEFTGIDDGEEEKTINLKLKEDYKRGGFGSATLAGGTASTYDGKLNYNRFTPQMQAAAIISGNNVNKQPFTFNEYISFMGGLGNAISNTNSALNFGEFGRGSTPQGITDNISAGLNFNYDLSSKVKLSSHYFYIDARQDLNRVSNSSQFTEDTTFETIDNTIGDFINRNHRLHAKINYKPNPYTQVKWRNTFSSIGNNNMTESATEFSRMGVNSGSTSSDVIEEELQQGIDGALTIRKRFEKKGRSWLNTANYQLGVLEATYNLDNTIINATSILDIIQQQSYDYGKSGLKLESAFTEPLSNRVFLSADYSFEYDQESPEKLFFDVFNEQGVLNEDLSRSYVKTNQIHQGYLRMRRNTKKLKMNGGIGVQVSNIEGAIMDESNGIIDDLNNRSTFFLPQLSLDYDLSKDASVDLRYRTSVALPTLQQLAPLPDNTNPNLLRLGNPSLSPTYTHNIGLNYSVIDQFNFTNFFANVNLYLSQDQIINAVSLDENLLRTIQPINTDQYTSVQGYISYGSPIRPLKLRFNASSSLRWSLYDSFINNELSTISETTTNWRLSLNNRNKDHVDIATGIDLQFTDRKFDVNEDFNQSFFNYSLYIDGIFYIGETWSLASKYDYRSFSSEFFSEGQEFHLWNAAIQKSFADSKFSIMIQANDLLNQNQGVERNGGLNGLSDVRFNTRARYFTLGLKVKLGKSKKTGIGL